MIYKTSGVCSQEIHFDIENNILKNVSFVGGCSGNTQGIAKLVEGMSVDEVINRLDGLKCGYRPTSCPDQLAKALRAYQQK
ncbi:TIGR03905 family TSCPD domain-containing protein [Anaerosporobacter faecicola]|uniref:TIGR03905 family TSCPD domain-containing protein n=1 Tax=Anaerosporobacter faecicola TaxID=2718714 RepID=UPI00143A289E|nr:TIGR03905 family TSCPD domain-containing protein [Anaerosporobacter faecicola]